MIGRSAAAAPPPVPGPPHRPCARTPHNDVTARGASKGHQRTAGTPPNEQSRHGSNRGGTRPRGNTLMTATPTVPAPPPVATDPIATDPVRGVEGPDHDLPVLEDFLARALKEVTAARLRRLPCGGTCQPALWPPDGWICSAYNSGLDATCARVQDHPGEHISCIGDEHAVASWRGRRAPQEVAS